MRDIPFQGKFDVNRMVENFSFTNLIFKSMFLFPALYERFRPVRLDFSNCGYGIYPARGGLFSKGRKTLSHLGAALLQHSPTS